jgi:16S rRNA (uracil1498-N3)-methyltransferase
MAIFYLEHCIDARVGEKIEIYDDDLFHHLTRVLRVQPGDNLKFFDKNNIFNTTVESFGGERLVCIVANINEINFRFPLINLLQAVVQKDLIEMIIRINEPFFIKSFAFFRGRRSQFVLKGNNILRFRKIALSVAEQSETCIRPDVASLGNIEEAIDLYKNTYLLVLHPRTNRFLSDLISEIKDLEEISLVVGPEGGFSQSEIKILQESKANFISLRTGIFKSEYAGFAASAILRELL